MTTGSNPSYQSDAAALRERVAHGDADAADEVLDELMDESPESGSFSARR